MLTPARPNLSSWIFPVIATFVVLIVAIYGAYLSRSTVSSDVPMKPVPSPTRPIPVPIHENVRVHSPIPYQQVTSPLTISGEARGTWFFEASFPVVLTDSEGTVLAEGHAQADGEWMTTEFVPFTATLTFDAKRDAKSIDGRLILKKDNPSGLPENDDAIEIPVSFFPSQTGSKPEPVACTMDAKICPDGSAVGRTAPDCEFAPCPGE